MRRRSPLFFAVALATGLSAAAFAQAPGRPGDAPPTTPAMPARPPPPRPATLDELFERLVKAKNPAEGKGIADRIERLWSRNASDTANLLMSRATRVMRGQGSDLALALELLDRVVELQPDWAEAWNRRATAFYLLGDMQRSILDVRRVLSLEPRHFGALAGLGHILAQLGENKQALEAYRRALAIHPQLEAIKKAADKLISEVEGQPT